jgi:hypothetical protein
MLFVFLMPTVFVVLALAFAWYALRAYRSRDYWSMTARLCCLAISVYGGEEMTRLALMWLHTL